MDALVTLVWWFLARPPRRTDRSFRHLSICLESLRVPILGFVYKDAKRKPPTLEVSLLRQSHLHPEQRFEERSASHCHKLGLLFSCFLCGRKKLTPSSSVTLVSQITSRPWKRPLNPTEQRMALNQLKTLKP